MNQQKSTLNRAITLALASIVSLALTACGSSNDRKKPAYEHGHDHSHNHEDGHNHEHDNNKGHDHGHGHDHAHGHDETAAKQEIDKGRLLISDHTGNKAYVYSIAQNKVIQTIDLPTKANALLSSPEGNHALIYSTETNQINFYDSGLMVEEHGDHHHYYANDAKATGLKLNYVGLSHYQTHDKQGVLFFDGKGKQGNPLNDFEQAAGFALVTNKGINAGKLPYQKLKNNMHGTAEARGQYILATARLNNIDNSLADAVELYQQHGDHYHKEQTFDVKCPNLHGSGSVTNYSVFACADGVLSIKQDGDKFTATKIANPPSIADNMCQRPNRDPVPTRIGSFTTNHHHDFLVGAACGQPYTVNPETKEIAPITWTSDKNRKITSYEFDAHGEHLLLLDNVGQLHILDVAQNFKPVASLNVFSKEDSGYAALVSNPNTGLVYLLDSKNKRIQVVNPETAKLETINLDFEPDDLIWFGVKKH